MKRTSHRRQHRVGSLVGDDLLDELRGHGPDVSAVGSAWVGHDGGLLRSDEVPIFCFCFFFDEFFRLKKKIGRSFFSLSLRRKMHLLPFFLFSATHRVGVQEDDAVSLGPGTGRSEKGRMSKWRSRLR